MLAYLIRQSRVLMGAAILASVVSGVCSVLLVAQINVALTAEAPAPLVTAVSRWPCASMV